MQEITSENKLSIFYENNHKFTQSINLIEQITYFQLPCHLKKKLLLPLPSLWQMGQSHTQLIFLHYSKKQS